MVALRDTLGIYHLPVIFLIVLPSFFSFPRPIFFSFFLSDFLVLVMTISFVFFSDFSIQRKTLSITSSLPSVSISPLTPCVHKKVIYTETNQELKPAYFFKYALKG